MASQAGQCGTAANWTPGPTPGMNMIGSILSLAAGAYAGARTGFCHRMIQFEEKIKYQNMKQHLLESDHSWQHREAEFPGPCPHNWPELHGVIITWPRTNCPGYTPRAAETILNIFHSWTKIFSQILMMTTNLHCPGCWGQLPSSTVFWPWPHFPAIQRIHFTVQFYNLFMCISSKLVQFYL